MVIEEEIGYPHDLILKALNQSIIAIDGNYSKRVKLLAIFLRHILEEKHPRIGPEEGDDSTFLLLDSLITGFPSKVGKRISDFMEELKTRSAEYESLHSQTSYDRFIAFLKEGVFLHILCKEEKNSNLLKPHDIDKFIGLLDTKENGLRAVLSAIKFWRMKKNNLIPQNMIFEFTSFDDKVLREAAVFLSYILATKYPKNKRELLIVHYLLVKKTVAEFSDIGTQQNLSDDLLSDLFKLAIVLFYCGYLRSLRLPEEEKNQYAQNTLQLPSIENSFKEAFNLVASVKLPRIPLKLPLWSLLAINSILLILHAFIEVNLPFNLARFGFQYTISSLPLFLTLAFFTSIYSLFRFYKLESNIVKKLRRGKREH